jgi:hypothetical protein
MRTNKVHQVSEICKHIQDNKYIYGFTITYSNGKIRNVIRKGNYEDENILQEMKKRKHEYDLQKEVNP